MSAQRLDGFYKLTMLIRQDPVKNGMGSSVPAVLATNGAPPSAASGTSSAPTSAAAATPTNKCIYILFVLPSYLAPGQSIKSSHATT